MDKNELDKILKEHKLWLEENGEGKRADLSHANLIHANLNHANLRGANLIHADLSYANLRGADPNHADLSYADLSHANLRGANLRGADLRGADLRGANLDFSVLLLWCGSFEMKVDRNIYTQILYHICRLSVDDEECKAHQKLSRELANGADVRERHGLPEIVIK